MRLTHLISKGLLSLLMTFSASMYFFKYSDVQASFENLGFPVYIIIPLAILKIAGILTIWFSKNRSLNEWAYAGFFFNTLLAITAHINKNDGEWMGAFLGMIFVLVAYFTYTRLLKKD